MRRYSYTIRTRTHAFTHSSGNSNQMAYHINTIYCTKDHKYCITTSQRFFFSFHFIPFRSFTQNECRMQPINTVRYHWNTTVFISLKVKRIHHIQSFGHDFFSLDALICISDRRLVENEVILDDNKRQTKRVQSIILIILKALTLFKTHER